MSTIVISSALAATQTFGLDDDVLITPDGSVTVSSGTGLRSADFNYSLNLTMYGDVFARNQAIQLSGTPTGHAQEGGVGDHWACIGAGARVTTFNDFQEAIQLYGSGNRVENDGTIYSAGSWGINFRGTDAELINRGVISGLNGGVNQDGQGGTEDARIVVSRTVLLDANDFLL